MISPISLWSFLFLIGVHGICFADNPPVKEERKTVVVTSASGELGAATARLLAQDYNLILTGRNLVKLKALQEELRTRNAGQYIIKNLDFLSRPSRDSFKDYLNQLKQPIVGIVLITPRPQFHGTSVFQDENVWLQVFQSTFTGPIEALRIMLPYLSNSGKIVVIAGTTSVQFQPDYGLAGVIRRMWTTYTKALSYQLGLRGTCVNALSPGVVLTDFHEKRIQKKADDNGLSYADQLKQEVSNIPLHRHAKPQEVAQAIRFLLSEESDFINGINLVLDGGSNLSY